MRLALVILVVILMSPTIPWFLIFMFLIVATLVSAHELYLLATKAPVTIDLLNDVVQCKFAFGKMLNLKYGDINHLAFDSSRKRFVGFTAKLIISSSPELFIEPTTMKNFPTLVRMFMDKNQNCIIDDYFKKMIAA